MERIQYKYRGINLADYNVVVKASSGVIDLPAAKERKAYEWDDMHGRIVDTQATTRFTARKIALECAVQGATNDEFLSNVRALSALLQQSGLGVLEVVLPQLPERPLAFYCYPTSGLAVTKKWSDGQVLGSFTLEFEEPEPLKAVLKVTRPGNDVSVSFNPIAGEVYHVYGVDASKQTTADATSRLSVTTETTAKTTYLFISGNMSAESAISATNASVLWNLQ